MAMEEERPDPPVYVEQNDKLTSLLRFAILHRMPHKRTIGQTSTTAITVSHPRNPSCRHLHYRLQLRNLSMIINITLIKAFNYLIRFLRDEVTFKTKPLIGPNVARFPREIMSVLVVVIYH